MASREVLERLIAMHKRINVNNLTDQQWRDYKEERRELEAELVESRTKSVACKRSNCRNCKNCSCTCHKRDSEDR